MTGIVVQDFNGIAPKISPKKLAEDMATIAQNVRLDRDVLEPFRAITGQETVGSTVQSLYPYQGAWLTSTQEVDYVSALLPNDPRDTLYYSDENYPKIRSGVAEYRLGIPRPSAAPVIASSTAGEDTRSYVCTFVDAWGYEGPPSDPSISVSVQDATAVTLTLPTFPAGNYNFDATAKVRIYRVNTGDLGAVYQYVGETTSGDAGWPNFTDSVPNSLLQEALVSEAWIGPPDDDLASHPDGPLQGLISLTNGALAGFAGNTLYFSEPYVPHAWPMAYRISGEEKIVSIAETQAGIVVGTTGSPWLVVGTHPEAMARVELPVREACVSKNSMVDMGEYAIYASPDGLVRLSGNDAVVVTAEYFSRDEWQQYAPSTIRAFYYEGKYVAFYGALSDATGFVFDPMGGKDAFTQLGGLQVVKGHTDQESGEASVIFFNGTDRRIGTFDTGSALSYVWQTKEFVNPKLIGLSVCRIQAEEYPITVTVYGDGYEIDNFLVYNENPVRLVSSEKCRVWQFKVEGTTRVAYFGFWDSMAEVV
jgi:hypothetical protein